MTLKSAPYWWVECNNCGARCEYGDFSAMAESGSAVDDAADDGWSCHGEKHHCPDCPPLCEKCGENSGDLSGERDYLCKACFCMEHHPVPDQELGDREASHA